MAFRFKTDQPIVSEIRRIVLHQLEVAIADLKSIGDPESDEAVHDARRRVKKIRATILLVQPALDKTYRVVDRHLRDMNRLLAPVADGQGIIASLTALEYRYPKELPAQTVASIRAGLVDRQSKADRQAGSEHVLETVAGALRAERRHVKHWNLPTRGFPAIAAGLEQSFRQSRQARLAAHRHPTAGHYHGWRRRVKNHWFHVRLLEARCGDLLTADLRRLEALDGILGEYHDVELLGAALVNDGYVSRLETARCLRVVLQYQRVMRRNAQSLGARIYSEKPRDFVRRLKHLWGPSPSDDRVRRAAR